ncbi:GNAT family N-acetyltransferase [Microbaculum marinum]|uniref:GNAT family N-acetyltransferase n=1 Tax=Microbaculum marinum TaxID=1764581 RepID=A0AAW9RUA8_9HYPH
MTANPSIRVVPLAPEHRAAWEELFAGYAAFYKVEQTPQMRETVWGWHFDPDHESEALVALDADGRPIGLAHFQKFSRPLGANVAGFLNDLFVEPDSRGSGAAEALIEAVCEIGRERGWAAIRWLTAEDNYRGRSFYDRLARKTPFIAYQIDL